MICAGFDHLLVTQKRVCGIYKITSSYFGIYIGQSVDIARRFKEHKAGRSSNKKLAASIYMDGYQSHRFEILEVCEFAQLNEREKYYVSLYKSFNSIHGFNSTKGGGSWPIMSEETKRKIGEKSKGRKLSPERIADIKARNTGREVPEELRLRLSKALKGRIFTEDHKRKIGAKHKGRKHSEAFCKNISEKRKGYKLPEEKRKEWSINRMGEKNNFFGKKHSEEVRQKMKDAWALRKLKKNQE